MEKLIEKYLTAEAQLEIAKYNFEEVKSELIAAIGSAQLDGTDTREYGHWKVSVSNKLNRTLDHAAYESIAATLPEALRFVEYKPSIVLKTLRHLEAIDPAIVAQCVTVKPAKPSLKIQEIE